MPIAPTTIDQLAAQLEPGAALLLAGLPSTVPPPPRFDRGALVAWLTTLTDEQQRAVVEHLAPSPLTAAARRELDGPIRIAAAATPEPPIATVLGVANVDREPVMARLASLRDSDSRLFVVSGPAGAGKSRAAELAQHFVEAHLGAAHRVVTIDLAGLGSLDAVVAMFGSELGTTLAVTSFTAANTTIEAWAKIVAKGLLSGVRKVLGPTVTPWIVFDHYERMPPGDGSGAMFLAAFALEVAMARKHAAAPRAVFIDHDVPTQVTRYTEQLVLAPVERAEVAAFLTRRDGLSAAAAQARADELIAQARAECAQIGDTHEVQYMTFLADALGPS